MRIAKIKTIDKALELKLQELYDIETHTEKALKKLIHRTETPLLQECFKRHLEETSEQIVRLEEAFALLEVRPKKLRVQGIRGIALDGETTADMKGLAEIKDSMLAGSARFVEHYEIAGYLSALAYAQLQGYTGIQRLLQASLQEEQNMDSVLTKVSAELSKQVI